jgi:hypothetical protein
MQSTINSPLISPTSFYFYSSRTAIAYQMREEEGKEIFDEAPPTPADPSKSSSKQVNPQLECAVNKYQDIDDDEQEGDF